MVIAGGSGGSGMVRISSVAESEEREVPDVTLRPAKVIHIGTAYRSLLMKIK